MFVTFGKGVVVCIHRIAVQENEQNGIPLCEQGVAALSHVFAKFHVPVREIDEMFPTVVLLQAEIDLHERTPFRTLGFANETNAGFLRSAIRLARVALDAGADNVFPGCRAAAIAGNHVIEIQILAVKNFAAILAGVLVAFENIMARELHFLFRKVIEYGEQNHARNSDAKRNRADTFRMRFLLGEFVPLGKAEGAEGTIAAIENRLGVSLEEQRQRAACGADVDSLPKTVQNKHMLVQH